MALLLLLLTTIKRPWDVLGEKRWPRNSSTSFLHSLSPLGLSQAFYLEVPALGLKPIVDETLRVSGKAQHELSLRLQLVDSFYCLVDLKGRRTLHFQAREALS